MKAQGFWLGFFTLCACEGSVVTPSATCPETGFSSHPKNAEYSTKLAQSCADSSAPGCVLLIARPGEPLWVGATGFSNLTTGAPMCLSTPFRMASVTKSFTATVVMKLVEEGKVKLTDTVDQLLPDVAPHIPSASQITVEQLLAHRSGVPSPDNHDLYAELDNIDRAQRMGALTTEERLRRLTYDRALDFSPGSKYGYSNPGYLLLGSIVERIENAPLQSVMQRIIFTPLGLTSSSLDADDPAIAHGYAFAGSAALMDVSPFGRAEVGSGGGYGSLVSNAQEVGAFFTALFSGRLVSQATLDTMLAPHTTFPNSWAYGLGIHIPVPGAAGHNGGLMGVHTFAYSLKDTLVVSLRNSGDPTGDDDARTLALLVEVAQ